MRMRPPSQPPSRRCRTTGAAAALPFRFLRPLVLYFAKAISFLTDFTPETPRAISEALALAPIVATWPVNVTTPASVRTSTFLSCESLERRVSTAFAMSLSLASTACRAAGVTTWRSFFTDFTPSTPFAMSLAALLASAESTLPRRWTTPLAVSTLTWVPFTRSSAEERDLGLGGDPAIGDHCLGFLRRGLGLLVGGARRQRGCGDERHHDRCRSCRSTVSHCPILLTHGFNAIYSPATRRCLVAEISPRSSLC